MSQLYRAGSILLVMASLMLGAWLYGYQHVKSQWDAEKTVDEILAKAVIKKQGLDNEKIFSDAKSRTDRLDAYYKRLLYAKNNPSPNPVTGGKPRNDDAIACGDPEGHGQAFEHACLIVANQLMTFHEWVVRHDVPMVA